MIYHSKKKKKEPDVWWTGSVQCYHGELMLSIITANNIKILWAMMTDMNTYILDFKELQIGLQGQKKTYQ